MDEEIPKTVATIADFLAWAQNFSEQDGTILFRGQTVQGNLLPSVVRSDPQIDTTQKEGNVLSEFKRKAAAIYSMPQESELDYLMLAQHHGLKTRLLDWTGNPLFALWFACAGAVRHSRKLGYVYSLKADKYTLEWSNTKSPFAHEETTIIRPRHSNPRVAAQDGWFTLHKFSKSSQMFVSLEKHKTIKHDIDEITIERPDQILKNLDKIGVNSRVLFPDLTGLCQQLNLYFEL